MLLYSKILENTEMEIPFVDLRKQYKFLSKDIQTSLNKIFASGNFIKGSILEEFEREFAKFIGSRYCTGVASGTDALYLSLLSLGIKKEDEVILPVNTFIATVYAVLYTGAKPVFIDIDPETFNINSELIESKITSNTKAIIPVHLYGLPAEMDRIMKISGKHRLFVIEDACQAHGAVYKGKSVGTFGDLAAFSFYPSKNLGACGDGGAIVTNSAKLNKLIKSLSEYGFTSKYTYNRIGINSRLDNIQAAILKVKLKYLNQWNKKRRALANYYSKILNKEMPFIKTPVIGNNSFSTYHLYVIRTPRRTKLAKFLSSRRIQTMIHYPIPLHLQKSLTCLGYKKGDFPVAEEISTDILSLPLYPELTNKQQDYVVESIKIFFKQV